RALPQQALDALPAGLLQRLQDALHGRVAQRGDAALDLLVLQARVPEDRLHLAQAEAVHLAHQPQVGARLRPPPPVALAPPLAPRRPPPPPAGEPAPAAGPPAAAAGRAPPACRPARPPARPGTPGRNTARPPRCA